MKTQQRIDIKRQELDRLRLSIRRTLGAPRPTRGAGLGLVLIGFAAGVLVERIGWRPLASGALTANHWASTALHTVAPALAFLRQ